MYVLYMYIHIALHLNPLQNCWVEDVHASIDLVGDKYLRLFNKPVDLSTLWVVHYNTIFTGFINLGHLVQDMM